ncbi:MAG TPA: adenylate cyclase regulatory domain-containing protein [Gemmatimonadaceae bacterium]|nr:adenylate cyclase regulatory domain-containing protein [Gemmatimonadaceae bacterium]
MSDTEEFESAGLLAGIDDPDKREQRLELLRHLRDDGFTIEELQEAASSERLALLPVDRVLSTKGAKYTSADLAEESGISLDLLQQLWRALGFTEIDPSEKVFGDADLEAVRSVAQFHAAGIDDEPLTLISQVIGSGMSRLSDAIRETVGEALLQPGDTELTVGTRYAAAIEHLVPLLTPVLGYVLTVHMKEQVKSNFIAQTEIDSGQFDNSRDITVCFADLVGFTRLGERVPPRELSDAARRLSDMALDVARSPVRLVKTIGDAAMLVSPEPEPMVRAALELAARAEENEDVMPQLRVGLASGPAVPQSGDWFGPPVNLASRVSDIARPASVLVTKPVRDALKDEFHWSFAGARKLKGVRDEVPLYRARPKTEEDEADDG